MKQYRLHAVIMIVLLCLTTELVLAQEATPEATANSNPTADALPGGWHRSDGLRHDRNQSRRYGRSLVGLL